MISTKQYLFALCICLQAFVGLCSQNYQVAVTSAESKSVSFPDNFLVSIDEYHDMVNVFELNPSWESGTIKARNGETIHKFRKKNKGQLRIKLPIAGLERGSYFCHIRFKDGSSAMRTFTITRS